MRATVVAVCTLIALAIAPSALADVRIGSTLAAPASSGFDCEMQGGCTLSSVAIPGQQVTAPDAGVVTRWQISAGPAVTAVSLQVVRRSGPAPQQGVEVGRSAEVTPPVDMTSEHLTRIPIEPGDYLGIDCCKTGGGSFFAPGTGGTVDGWAPPLGAELKDPFVTGSANELLVSADIEPDADGDGFGDETQDNCRFIRNSGQDDGDGDGVGDACDTCPSEFGATPSGCPAPPPPPPPASPAPQPPVARFRTPLAGTAIGPSQRIELDVADDSGDPVVTVFDDDGTICVLRAAPYACTWNPTGADVGRATLLASAVDAGGLSTLAIVRVRVNRFTASLKRTVRRRGRSLRVTGRLVLPAAVERLLGCRGNVTVRVGRVKRTAALTRRCTYATQLRVRTGRPRVSFAGNSVLAPST